MSDVQDGVVPQTIWLHDEVGNTQEAKKEVLANALDSDEVFQTPKPEKLLKSILEIATTLKILSLTPLLAPERPVQLLKMGRRWIMIELSEHIHSNIVPRFKRIIDGADLGGVTEAAGWKGGGGFRYFKLAS